MVNIAEEKTFVSITNQDIYDKIEEMHTELKITNGQVKTNRKITNVLIYWLGILTAGFLAGVIFM